MSLTSYLTEGLLPEQEKKKVVAVYGGGFKPPTSGHFEVVKQALKENPEIDEFIILIGGKPRNGITPDESILIWDIYKTYLPFKVEVKYTSTPPIKGIYNYAKEHPDEEVLFIIGAREGNEEDFKDIASRTTSLDKYPNLNLRTIVTQGGVSGTAARNASKISLDKFKRFVPSELSDEEVEQVYNIVADKIQEVLTENNEVDELESLLNKWSAYSGQYDLLPDIAKLAKNLGVNNGPSIVYRAVPGLDDYPFTKQEVIDYDKEQEIVATTPTRKQAEYFITDNADWAYILEYKPHIIINFDEFEKKYGWSGNWGEGEILIDVTKSKLVNIEDYTKKQSINENASYSKEIDIQDKIDRLTQHMIDKGMNIEPLPTLEFVDGDSENASDFFGKTAYYDPNKQHIVLYTEGRHPKDIVRSYAHEMIHHIQHLEDRLGDVAGTDTTSDDHLDKIEQEANLRGTMTFRNWTDSILNENTSLSFPNSALLFGGFFTGIQRMGIGKTIISDLFKSNPKLDNLLLYTQDDAIGFWKKLGGKIIQQGEDKKGTLRYFVQINKNDVDTNLNLKQLGISYKNLSTKKSKIAKGEYAIKMGRQKIGFFFVRDIGTIQMDPMNIFANNLNENLNEIGDASSKSFKWEESSENFTYVDHIAKFTTDLGTKYEVHIDVYNEYYEDGNKIYKMLNVSFFVEDVDPNQVINKGELFPVMATIFDITKYYLKKLKANGIIYDPAKKSKEGFADNQRNRLYKAYIKKAFPNAKIKEDGIEIIVLLDDKSLNEAIVGEKIECDNCGWSWNIVDGGDDLYTCHKCWHDNTPIEEKKNKDPFGLNAYARELAMGLEENKVMDYKIYCDMDGVLVDFERGYEELTGIDLRGEFQKGDDFWDPISEKGVGFWAGLKWMPDGQELWNYLKPYKPDLLSAPSREDSSRIGKHVWVKHKIPGTKLILRYASQKQELANPESILIDDRQVNIDQWEAAGGIGILHTSADNTIKQLKQLGL